MAPPGQISIVIADDHPVVLKGLQSLISAEPDMCVLATAPDGAQALATIRELRPDIAVLDISMPDLSGLDVLTAAAGEKLPTKVVVLTASARDNQIVAAVNGGARGLMLKDAAPDELVDCLRAVANGELWHPPELVAEAFARYAESGSEGRSAAMQLLTPRERQIVTLVAEGLSNKEIARALSVSEGTIKIHLHNIYKKLNVPNRTSLAAFAFPHLNVPDQ
jgi:DNA-binding NarL/FixJ family response regulator